MPDHSPSRFAPARRTLLPGLTRRNVGTEVLAGITLLAIALPLNIGYAQIAGLPPTAGLYALVLPSVVFALLASSRHLVAAPDAAAAALVGSALSGVAVAGTDQYAAMAAAQAIVGGLLFLACAVFRLGFLADFLSKPILIGFVGGLATDILLSQIAKMMGIKVASGAEFFERLAELVTRLGSVHWWSLGLSLAVIAVLVPARRRMPTVPWALIVLIAATVASVALHLPAHGVGGARIGAVRTAGPGGSRGWTGTQWVAVILPALAITTVTVGEGLLLARSYADKYGYTTSPNRDLAAFGAANIASGLSSGFTIGSSTSRAAAMDQAGSRTQLPLLVMAGGALLLLVFGAGPAGRHPVTGHRGDRRGVGGQADRHRRAAPSVATVPVRIRRRSNVFRRCPADRPAGRDRAGVRAVADQPAAQGRPAGGGHPAGLRRPAPVADRVRRRRRARRCPG